MIITVDQGNTKLKAARFDDNGGIEVDVKDQLRGWLNASKPNDTLIYSDVSGQFDLDQLKSFKGRIITFGHDIPLPITLDYETPETLGLDRIALACGAQHNHANKTCMIIDAGSCITMDLLSIEGVFQGGIISPGISMRLKAMSQFTGKLPSLSPQAITSTIGRSTNQCMQVGAVHGAIKEIHQTVAEWKAQYNNLTVIGCGGDWHYFDNAFKNDIFAEPNLMFYGLKAIAEHHEK